jgi:hypothetical protein
MQRLTFGSTEYNKLYITLHTDTPFARACLRNDEVGARCVENLCGSMVKLLPLTISTRKGDDDSRSRQDRDDSLYRTTLRTCPSRAVCGKHSIVRGRSVEPTRTSPFLVFILAFPEKTFSPQRRIYLQYRCGRLNTELEVRLHSE